MSEDGNFMEQRGEGLMMPNGDPVPSMSLLAPSAGYDPFAPRSPSGSRGG